MALLRFYPVLMVEDVEESAGFYREHLGFETTFESDWYISLKHRENPAYELAVLLPTHETIPEGFRGQQAGGILLNFEVKDVTAEYARLKRAGLQIVRPLRDEAFGQRHFIGVAPGGVMIDIIQEIPPAPEYAGQFVSLPDVETSA